MLLYADDVALADPLRTDLEEQVQQWYGRLSENGLKINIAKTEDLEWGPQTNGTIRIDSQELKKTAQFKYLGSLVTSDGDTISDTPSKNQRGVAQVETGHRSPVW